MRQLYPFQKCVELLFAEGFITEPMPVTTNVYTCTVERGLSWGAIARELAMYLPGMIQITGNGDGIVWINGAGSPHGVLMELGELLRAREAKEIAESISGCKIEKAYSIGKSARHLLDFVGVPHLDKNGKAPKSVERLLQGITYGYHACVPGEYENVTMYDVSAYYYNLLRRLKSLRLTVDDDGIMYEGMTTNEQSRWRDVLDGIAEYKPLRNTLAGVCAGSTRWLPFWTFDKKSNRVVRKHKPPNAGKFRGAGLLVVHTGYVLCRANHLTSESIYSTIDCVTTPNGEPSLWNRYGFNVGIKTDKKGNPATGHATIAQRGSYRIGSVVTEPFKNGIVEPLQVDDTGEPPIDYSRHLLEG